MRTNLTFYVINVLQYFKLNQGVSTALSLVKYIVGHTSFFEVAPQEARWIAIIAGRGRSAEIIVTATSPSLQNNCSSIILLKGISSITPIL